MMFVSPETSHDREAALRRTKSGCKLYIQYTQAHGHCVLVPMEIMRGSPAICVTLPPPSSYFPALVWLHAHSTGVRGLKNLTSPAERSSFDPRLAHGACKAAPRASVPYERKDAILFWYVEAMASVLGRSARRTPPQLAGLYGVKF